MLFSISISIYYNMFNLAEDNTKKKFPDKAITA